MYISRSPKPIPWGESPIISSLYGNRNTHLFYSQNGEILWFIGLFSTEDRLLRNGTTPSDWCQALCPFAETYPIKPETCPQLLKSHIHSYKQMQSVTKLTFTSRSWPLKSMGTNQHKVLSTYIMQGKFTLLPPATVSTVETVNVSQLLHNPSVLTADWPYTRRELSCWISPSRPGIRSSFYLYHICPSFH